MINGIEFRIGHHPNWCFIQYFVVISIGFLGIQISKDAAICFTQACR